MTSLRLYNTATRTKETFVPIDPSDVRFYICGPTVYDFAHLGNARAYVSFDVLYRVLRYLYPKVTYARNLTDVDDKIIQAALQNKESIESVTKRTTEAFHVDMHSLKNLAPTIEPRATEHIPHMITMIEGLIEKGFAYASQNHVLFRVSSDSTYGSLSNRSVDEMIAGARVEVAPYKQDPMDFVLWKPSTPDQPGWESPWGRGRPGWHIECSAMSAAYLGVTFDIHGGGLDLIFPHHENELAQSTCYHGKPFVNYWLHNGYLVVNGEKMSKSLGNFFTVRQILEKYPGEAIRYAFLNTHYRQPLDWTDKGIQSAKQSLDRLYQALRNTPISSSTPAELPEIFLNALLDDLNTPLTLSVLHELASELNKSTNPAEKEKLAHTLKTSANFLGLLEDAPTTWFQANKEEASCSPKEIEVLIEARKKARLEKRFEDADIIRKELLSKGVILEDTSSGTTWRRV